MSSIAYLSLLLEYVLMEKFLVSFHDFCIRISSFICVNAVKQEYIIYDMLYIDVFSVYI